MVESPAKSTRLRNRIIAAALVGAALVAFLILRSGPTAPEPTAETEETAPSRLGVPKLLTAPGQDRVKRAKTPSEQDAAIARAAVCKRCEDDNRGKEGCEANMGCEQLTGSDKIVCESLVNCLEANPECWGEDLQKCYCGNTTGTDCARIPNGPCAAESIAAAQTDSPLTAGIRYFKTEFPSGHATQKVVCHMTVCKSECAR